MISLYFNSIGLEWHFPSLLSKTKDVMWNYSLGGTEEEFAVQQQLLKDIAQYKHDMAALKESQNLLVHGLQDRWSFEILRGIGRLNAVTTKSSEEKSLIFVKMTIICWPKY